MQSSLMIPSPPGGVCDLILVPVLGEPRIESCHEGLHPFSGGRGGRRDRWAFENVPTSKVPEGYLPASVPGAVAW